MFVKTQRKNASYFSFDIIRVHDNKNNDYCNICYPNLFLQLLLYTVHMSFFLSHICVPSNIPRTLDVIERS